MLKITRRNCEKGITIVAPTGETLKLYVTKISRNNVELSFEKFEGFKVWRQELWEKMQAEKAVDGLPKNMVN